MKLYKKLNGIARQANEEYAGWKLTKGMVFAIEMYSLFIAYKGLEAEDIIVNTTLPVVGVLGAGLARYMGKVIDYGYIWSKRSSNVKEKFEQVNKRISKLEKKLK